LTYQIKSLGLSGMKLNTEGAKEVAVFLPIEAIAALQGAIY
jgi:hypothetical protein